MATTTYYTPIAEHSNGTIVVTNNAELNAAIDALSSGSGGTIQLDGNGGPYDILVGDYNGPTNSSDTPIHITSLDDNNPALVKQISFIKASSFTLSNLNVDSSDGHTPLYGSDVYVEGSDNIAIVDSTFTSSATEFYDENGGVVQGNNLSLFTHSQDVVFSGNEVSGYFHGIGVGELSGGEFIGNEIYEIQGDGFRGGGIENIVISDNYMHDFYGATQSSNHSDMIQIWGTGAKILNQNIEISGNTLDAADGAATQSIFIRNENFGANEPSGGYFQNIQIFDNFIHNGHYHGIGVSEIENLEIYNNTILWNTDAKMVAGPGEPGLTSPPWIRAANSINITLENNVGGNIYTYDAKGTLVENGNYIINYNDPGSDGYVDNHFYDVTGYTSLEDLQVLPDSPLYGVTGAPQSWMGWDGYDNDVPQEEPAPEPPVVDEPVAEEPPAEEPVVEEPVVQEPPAEEPVAEEPVAEEPVAEQPVDDRLGGDEEDEVVVEGDHMQDYTPEPPVEEPVIEEPVAEEPVAEEPVVEPVAEEPVAEEPVAEPVAEEPVAEEPVAEPVAEEPVAEEPVAEPVAEEPVAEEPVAEPVAEEPVAEEPVVEPVAETPEEPVVPDLVLVVDNDVPAEEPANPIPEDGQLAQEAFDKTFDGGSENFLSKLFEMLFGIFGGGKDDKGPALAQFAKGPKKDDDTADTAEETGEVTLADVVPLTAAPDENAAVEDEEDEEFEFWQAS